MGHKLQGIINDILDSKYIDFDKSNNDISNVDLLRRLSNLEKIVYGKNN